MSPFSNPDLRRRAEPAPVSGTGIGAPLEGRPSTRRRRAHVFVGFLGLHLLNLVIAAGAFVAYQHCRLQGQSSAALASLLVSAGFALAPVRALLRMIFALEHRVLHLVHGVGGLALIGLVATGAVSGGPVLTQAALAPFAIMGAAQALMHANAPRNAQQAEAMRRFVQSLPEIEQFTRTDSLASPQNAVRAVAVLSDLIAKAQALGETELAADPGFQGALRRVAMHTGLTLGLDAIDQAIGRLAGNPAVAAQVPALRKRLAAARRQLEAPRPPSTAPQHHP